MLQSRHCHWDAWGQAAHDIYMQLQLASVTACGNAGNVKPRGPDACLCCYALQVLQMRRVLPGSACSDWVMHQTWFAITRPHINLDLPEDWRDGTGTPIAKQLSGSSGQGRLSRQRTVFLRCFLVKQVHQ